MTYILQIDSNRISDATERDQLMRKVSHAFSSEWACLPQTSGPASSSATTFSMIVKGFGRADINSLLSAKCGTLAEKTVTVTAFNTAPSKYSGNAGIQIIRELYRAGQSLNY